MKKTLLLVVTLICAITFTTDAQKLALEKTYEITGKAKRGYLDDVQYDAGTRQTMLSFVTKSTNNFTGSKTKVLYQNYYFDQEYNFIKMEENEDVYKNKRYKGETYTVEGIYVQNNFTGTFVLRKKLITYTWDWFFGGYKKKVKLLEKVKPKDDSGNKYTLIRKFENDQNGDVVVMVIAKGKGANPNEYVTMKIDNALNFTVQDKFSFDKPQIIATSTLITSVENNEYDDSGLDEEAEGNEADDTDDQGDLSTSQPGLIFAASSAGKKAKADPHDYTFIRLSQEGKVLERTEIKTLASAWAINNIIAAGESIYMMGPANDGKYHDLGIPAGSDVEAMKWKLFQLVKITSGKVEYVTTTDLDEFEAKLKTPPSQKKTPSYQGKRFHFSGAQLYHDGSIFISGQNYKRDKKNNVQVKVYLDVVSFYFGKDGKLIAQYGVRREENNKYAKAAPTQQLVIPGNNTIYWTIFEMDGIRTEREGKFKSVKAKLYPNVARINPTTGEISDFVSFGTVNGKPAYYLHNQMPILKMTDDNAIVYMGTNQSGKTLWFGKVVMD
jgi:hypothetical protein